MEPDVTEADQQTSTGGSTPVRERLPMWRIGISGGLVGILCCVGPTVLAQPTTRRAA